jgi:putative phage-type endonuclease
MNFSIIAAEQRSPEWFAARAGRVTGSKAKAVLMGDKTAGRNDYKLQLAVERITGEPEVSDFTNEHIQRGIEKEPLARLKLEAERGIMVRETGFLSHNGMMIGASLDGDVDDFKTIIELKAPKTTTHVGYLKANVLPSEYTAQVMHNLIVTCAQSCIFASFDDRFLDGLHLFVVEVKASDLPLEEYSAALTKFLAEVDSLESELLEMQQQHSLKKAA